MKKQNSFTDLNTEINNIRPSISFW